MTVLPELKIRLIILGMIKFFFRAFRLSNKEELSA
jgi:hypothetical protein